MVSLGVKGEVGGSRKVGADCLEEEVAMGTRMTMHWAEEVLVEEQGYMWMIL